MMFHVHILASSGVGIVPVRFTSLRFGTCLAGLTTIATNSQMHEVTFSKLKR